MPILLFVMLSALASGCSHAQPRSPADPEVVLRAHGVEIRVAVELARTEAERQRGLMFRDQLEPGHGMLFLFEQPSRITFWMKNTYIPLDMIFIDQHRRVIAVEENAEPLTTNPRGPDADAQFVLEVPGGWARSHGVGAGVQAQFLGID